MDRESYNVGVQNSTDRFPQIVINLLEARSNFSKNGDRRESASTERPTAARTTSKRWTEEDLGRIIDVVNLETE